MPRVINRDRVTWPTAQSVIDALNSSGLSAEQHQESGFTIAAVFEVVTPSAKIPLTSECWQQIDPSRVWRAGTKNPGRDHRMGWPLQVWHWLELRKHRIHIRIAPENHALTVWRGRFELRLATRTINVAHDTKTESNHQGKDNEGICCIQS